MKVILISSAKTINNENELLTQLFDAGLVDFHLRKPSFTEAEMITYIDSIPEKYHQNIIIHSHFQLIKKFNLKGVHISSKLRNNPVKSYYKLFFLRFNHPELIISTSAYSLFDLLKPDEKHTYVILSPVFNSVSRTGYRTPFDEVEIRNHLNKTTNHVIARGGIDTETAIKAQNMGFKGVALQNLIWEHEKPLDKFKEMLSLLKVSSENPTKI